MRQRRSSELLRISSEDEAMRPKGCQRCEEALAGRNEICRRTGRLPRGFTLTEVLVAMVIFTLAGTGLVGLALALMEQNSVSRRLDTAAYLANDRLEQIRNTPYAQIVPANFPFEDYGAVTAGAPPVPYPDFQRRVTIQDDTPFPGMKRVIVTVSWPGPFSVRTVTLETLIGP